MYIEKETIDMFIFIAFIILSLWIYGISKDKKKLKEDLERENKNNEFIVNEFDDCKKELSKYGKKSEFKLYEITRTYINSKLQKEDVITFLMDSDEGLTVELEYQNKFDYYENGSISKNRFNKNNTTNKYKKCTFSNKEIFNSESNLLLSLFDDYISFEDDELFKIKDKDYPLTHILKNLDMYDIENMFLTYICKTSINGNKEIVIIKGFDINVLLIESIYKEV